MLLEPAGLPVKLRLRGGARREIQQQWIRGASAPVRNEPFGCRAGAIIGLPAMDVLSNCDSRIAAGQFSELLRLFRHCHHMTYFTAIEAVPEVFCRQERCGRYDNGAQLECGEKNLP